MTRPYNGNLREIAVDVPAHIDVAETIKQFSVDPRRLKPASARFVITSCATCGVSRTKKFSAAIKQRLCLKCSNRANGQNVEGRRKRGDRMRAYYQGGGTHPTKGKGHSAAARQKISTSRTGLKVNLSTAARQRLATRCQQILNSPQVKAKARAINQARRGPLSPRYGRPPAHTQKVWHNCLDGSRVCFRSSWEAVFATWLDSQQLSWFYESKAFPVSYMLHGTLIDGTYTPDFLVGDVWYEVKGLWTVDGAAKFEAFRTTYPDQEIHVVDRTWLRQRGLLPRRKR